MFECFNHFDFGNSLMKWLKRFVTMMTICFVFGSFCFGVGLLFVLFVCARVYV